MTIYDIIRQGLIGKQVYVPALDVHINVVDVQMAYDPSGGISGFHLIYLSYGGRRTVWQFVSIYDELKEE